MGHGFPATLQLLDVGVRPSLSIDIVTSIAGDMFSAMHALLTGARAVVNGEALRQGRMSTRCRSPLATCWSSRLSRAPAPAASGQTGSLTPGKQAERPCDTNSLNLFPSTTPTAPSSRPPMSATSIRCSWRESRASATASSWASISSNCGREWTPPATPSSPALVSPPMALGCPGPTRRRKPPSPPRTTHSLPPHPPPPRPDRARPDCRSRRRPAPSA